MLRQTALLFLVLAMTLIATEASSSTAAATSAAASTGSGTASTVAPTGTTQSPLITTKSGASGMMSLPVCLMMFVAFLVKLAGC